MKNLFIILILSLGISCMQDYKHTSEQKDLFRESKVLGFDTLIVDYQVCTECLNFYISQGKISYPKEMKHTHISTSDIEICGNFPKEYIDMTSLYYDPSLSFQIIGKVIKIENTYQVGNAPLFYVTEWKKFYFDSKDWQEKDDLGIYPKRKEMVENVMKYFKFEGRHLSEILSICVLRKPDFAGGNKISYQIELDYGFDIDPVATKDLVIALNDDSIITNKEIREWKK